MNKQVPVLFRKTLTGEVLAVMPSLPGPKGSIDSVCLGFNDKGEVFVDTTQLKHTQEATYEDYVHLQSKMAHAGYTNIRIIHRIKGAYVDMRTKARRGQKYVSPKERPLIVQAKAA